MTGPPGNRLSICPLRFRIASPRVSIDLRFASVNRKCLGGDPESPKANRSAYLPSRPVIICLIYPIQCPITNENCINDLLMCLRLYFNNLGTTVSFEGRVNISVVCMGPSY